MLSRIRHSAALVAVVALLPFVGGMTVSLTQCMMAGPIGACAMTECSDDASSGVVIGSPECCSVTHMTASVGTAVVKADPDTRMSFIESPLVVAAPFTFNSIPAVVALIDRSPDDHAPPLYITIRTLRI